MDCSPLRSCKNFPDLTNLTQIFQIWSYSVLVEIKVVWNYILNNLYLIYKHCLTAYFALFSVRELPKFTKLTNLDLAQFFQIWSKSVLIKKNDDNNVIYNNFEYHEQLLKMHCFLSKSWPKNDFVCKMAEFFQLPRLLEWKQCILESWSWSLKLFITSFLTTFIPTKTLYGVIGKNSFSFKESKISQLFHYLF